MTFDPIPAGWIFVFGSNLRGAHGGGAAADAIRLYGAVWGCGEGRQGSSYAIPTMGLQIEPLPLNRIEQYIKKFLVYANENSEEQFFVTRIGCGIAGYTDSQIAPMFHGAPVNVKLPEGWRA
jgi:hypothetical protein